MSKLPNIIQRRELEPVFIKALKIVKHYEKAANCAASVTGPDCDCEANHFYSICRQCSKNTANTENACSCMHMEAVNKARQLGGSYIYLCSEGLVFWTSPFYSGERFAGALFSGGVRSSEKNSDRVKALANMMLICADQISGMSFVQKSITSQMITSKAAYEQKIPVKNGSTQMKGNEEICSTDMERMLLACLRRGDNIEGKKILHSLLNTQYREVNENFPAFRLKAMELAVMLSRTAVDLDETEDETILDANSRYLKKIEDCSNFREITEVLTVITENMSGRIFSFHGVRHFSALRKAERYIWENYTRKLSLKEIACASGLSAPYFSTIFKEEMGENLSNYLNRLRIEKAATMLVTTDMPISEIAISCGFEDQSWFSKIFKNNTGLTPGKYREQGNILG